MTVPRGEWLSATHDRTYGSAFKARYLNFWGASRRFLSLVNAEASPDRDVYAFGVYTGGSMRAMAQKIRGFGHLWGFDSFIGLPKEAPGVYLEHGGHWRPGGFSAADALQEHRLPVLLERVRQHVKYANTTLISGFYDQSLTPELARRFAFRPALLVDVDVDLFSSSVACLSWLLSQRILVPGSFVRFDDWRQRGDLHGEARAFREVSVRYNVSWRNLGRQTGHEAFNTREWQVVSVGDPQQRRAWSPQRLRRAMRRLAPPAAMYAALVRA